MIDIDRLRSCLDDAHDSRAVAAFAVRGQSAGRARQLHADGRPRRDARPACRRSASSSPPPRRRWPIRTWRSTTWSGSSPRRAIRWRRPRCSSAIRDALPNLLQIFSTSQYLSDLLVADKEAYDLLRMTEGQPVARDGAGRGTGQRSARARQLRRGAGVAAAVQAPRDAADRLRRHRPQPAGRHGHAADFVPGRRDRRSGARFRPPASATSSTASRCAPTASAAGSSCSASASWAASS